MTEPVRQCCATCAWFNQGAPTVASAKRRAGGEPEVGTCQKHPPVVVRTHYFAVSMFPEVRDDRWCGMWESAFGDPDDGAREDLPEGNVIRFDGKAAA